MFNQMKYLFPLRKRRSSNRIEGQPSKFSKNVEGGRIVRRKTIIGSLGSEKEGHSDDHALPTSKRSTIVQNQTIIPMTEGTQRLFTEPSITETYQHYQPRYNTMLPLLRHAIEYYDFAMNYRGKYSDNVHKSPEYGSWAYVDELLWASAWLYRATMNTVYLTNAKTLWDENYLGYTPQRFDWDNKLAGAQILLARLAGWEPEYVTAAENFCRWIRNDAPRTPLGLIFLGPWSSLRSIATAAFACLQAAEINIDSEANRAMARSQIGYSLGDTGRSFVVGFGINPPVRPHHRASSCPSLPLPCNGDEALNNPGPKPQTLYGALVGGPGIDDSYVDDRQDYVKNEVALDYNAGFQSAIAGLISLRNRGLL